ncbi:MAG: VWA domain-containing protein [Alphaproteobacteria bacterium]|nr:VWA domain-containing protein [Alphaproteobacteria bacterium]
MSTFIWPWAILLLFIPILTRYILPAKRLETNAIPIALRVPFFHRLSSFLITNPISTGHKIAILLYLSWIFFVIACMRPIKFDEMLPLPREARNIMLAIDVSGSMAEQDFDLNGQPVTRLTMVKNVANDFIKKRTDDNLGLVIFGSEAYLYTPLSFDKKTLRSLFDEVSIGIAGEQTAIGDAIAKAVEGVSAAPADSRIVILLSDGYSNAGVIKVNEAIELAKKQNVKIYTIGVGSNQQLVQSFFGTFAVNPSLNLDEATLQEIARQTGGRYFRSKTTSELKEVYNAINELEQVNSENISVRPQTELFFIPLLISMILLLSAAILKRRQS